MPYLDYNSTTPTDQGVLDSMIPAFAENFGNPSSANHDTGRTAADLVSDARKSVADIVNMRPADVIFTSGATEANNMVFFGLSINRQRQINILVGATEHKSVLEPCEFLTRQGTTMKKIPVKEDGTLNLVALDEALSHGNIDIVSVMAANSETGVIHPIKEIVQRVHAHGALVHCDATQAIGKIPFDAESLDIDFVTFSSHKIYGPKGSGALVATRYARKEIQGILYGGGQENNMRSGTLNVPGIVGFGKACQIASKRMESDATLQQSIRNNFEERITKAISDVTINGKNARRLPNTSNIRINGARADAVILHAKQIEVSTGSACSSSTIEPSHVLVAMGLDGDEANQCIRISIGRQTTQQDMDIAINEIVKSVQYVRGKEMAESVN